MRVIAILIATAALRYIYIFKIFNFIYVRLLFVYVCVRILACVCNLKLKL